ncbi:hypothetical protein EDD18DRAFT_1127759 [Armillaria luteobubalina]|uniref:Secreted protein n=1 Tax=Armillaria luteobubalina TaxID=153913 RepID=A0AA39UVK4_9AGAR|nr:hypothetical protein EDD18DRAFT_1127759 [Armillaria luteobubalina]
MNYCCFRMFQAILIIISSLPPCALHPSASPGKEPGVATDALGGREGSRLIDVTYAVDQRESPWLVLHIHYKTT